MKLSVRLIILLSTLLSFKAISNKIVTISDDEWHDPSSWEHLVPENPDTIIIRHYITFGKDLVIKAPTVLIIENGATLCGDFLLDIECGARIYNYGNLFINAGKIRDGENHFRFFVKNLITISGCPQPEFGKGFYNRPPLGNTEVWPPVLCKTKDTYYPREDNTSISKVLRAEGISISPNPIKSGVLKITGLNDINASLYDNNGKLLTSIQQKDVVLISMEEYPRGLYFLVINSNGETIHRKVLKD